VERRGEYLAKNLPSASCSTKNSRIRNWWDCCLKNQFIPDREHAVFVIITTRLMMREVAYVYCENPMKYLNGVDKVRGCFNGHLLGTVICRVEFTYKWVSW